MALLYGVEVANGDKLKNLASSNGLDMVTYQGKTFIGTILTVKSCFRDTELAGLVHKAKRVEWHPRFISYLQNQVRLYSNNERFVPDVKIIAFDYLNSKIIAEVSIKEE